MTHSDPLGAHLAHLRLRNMRPNTIRARHEHIRRMAHTLGIDCDDTLLAVSRADLEAWQLTLAHLSPRYRVSFTAHVRSFYRWADNAELVSPNPAAALVSVRSPACVPRPIGEDDLAMAIACAPDRIRAMLVLAAYAGLRAYEIAGLTRDRVMDTSSPPVLLVHGKGGKERVVPMSDRVVAELRAHGIPTRGYLFPRGDGLPGANTAGRVSHICNDYLHDLGIVDTLHSLRHRFGSQLYQACTDLRLTQEVMGHGDPSTTAGYVAWSSTAATAAVAAMPGAGLAVVR